MIVAIVGPHAAGKTTVGEALARTLGWPFHEELGLRLSRELRQGGLAADAPQLALDEAIFAAELRRDEDSRGLPRVVETWHPGNLAYARRRSPRLAGAWAPRLRAAAAAGPVRVVALDADDAVLAARRHEPGDPRFFREVGRDAIALARAWALPVLPLRSDRPDPAALVVRILPFLELR